MATLGNGDIGLIHNLGLVLFHEYVVPFEISSVLFLSAMVGVVVIGKKRRRRRWASRVDRNTVDNLFMPINYYIFLAVAFVLYRGCRGVDAPERHHHLYVYRADVERRESAAGGFFQDALSCVERRNPNAGIDGQLFVFFIMVVAAAEVSVGLRSSS